MIHSNSSTGSITLDSSILSIYVFTLSLYIGFNLYGFFLIGLASGFNVLNTALDQTNQVQYSKQVSNLRNFLGDCLKLLSDKKSLQILHNLLEKCNLGEEGVKILN